MKLVIKWKLRESQRVRKRKKERAYAEEYRGRKKANFHKIEEKTENVCHFRKIGHCPCLSWV